MSSDPIVNPHHCNWSLVFIHYCDGTSFSSDATLPVPVPSDIRGNLSQAGSEAPQQIYFRGRNNLKAVFSYLKEHMGMANPTDVIYSGGSAGATAVYLSLDAVREWLPPVTRLVGAPDAGFFLDVLNLQRNTTWYRNCFQAADAFWNTTQSGGTNADCLAAYPMEAWKCFLPEYAARFIHTPYMILNAAYDMWSVLNDRAIGCVPSQDGQPVGGMPACTAQQMSQLAEWHNTFLQALSPSLNEYPHTGCFIDSCFVHEQNVDYCSGQSLPNCPGWHTYNVTVPGLAHPVTMDEAFYMWHTTVIDRWAEVVSARAAHRSSTVLPAIMIGDTNLRLASGKNKPSSIWKPELGIIQVIDSLEYPQNPSCPFPKPTSMYQLYV